MIHTPYVDNAAITDPDIVLPAFQSTRHLYVLHPVKKRREDICGQVRYHLERLVKEYNKFH